MNRSSVRRCLAAASSLLIVAGATQLSWAQSPAAHLKVLSQSGAATRLLLTVTGLTTGTTLDPSQVQVVVDGKPVAATSTSSGSGTTRPVARRVVLVFDTSGSMAGAGLDGARAAALAFLSAVPSDVQVGLVAFSDRPRLLVAPTTSRTHIRGAVASLFASGETSLYDGVSLALHVVGDTGDRALIVLSDGADTRSRASLADTERSLRLSGARMDAVALHTGDAVRRTLTAMAAATGGSVTAADSGTQLASAFSSAAQGFGTQISLDVALPASARGRTVTVNASVPAGALVLKASTELTVDGALAPQRTLEEAPSRHHSVPAVLLLVVFAAMGAVALMGAVAFDAGTSSGARTRKLLDLYTFARAAPSPEPEESSKVGNSGLVRRALALAERVAEKPARRDKLVLRLGRADVSLRPNEWLFVQFLLSVVGAVLGTVLFGTLGFGIVTAVAAYFGSNAWLAVKGRRRLRAFDEHLPNSLQLVAGSLSAGFSLAQALDGVVREGLEPISAELNRALAESRLGVPLEDALDGVAHRMDSMDFRWVVMAIRIQREVGGNLAEVLLNTAGMMRERARLRRQVKALSAEGRLSAYVLFAIPLLMTLYLLSFRRQYIRTLYTDPIGIGFMVSAVVLLCVGAVWMRKIVTVEV